MTPDDGVRVGHGSWLTVAVAVALVLEVTVLAVVFEGRPVAAFRDPTYDFVLAGALPVEAGWLSYAGALGWWTGAAVPVFAGLLLAPGPARRALVCGGLLSAGLAVDDLYLVHDLVVPERTPLPEAAVLLAWSVLVTGWALVHRTHIASTGHARLLGAAALLFVVSLAVDQLTAGRETPTSIIAEDAAKLAGITAWATFHVLWARAQVQRGMGGRAVRPSR